MTTQTCVTWLKRVTLLGVYAGLLMPLVFIPTVIFPFVFSKLIVFQIIVGLTFPAYFVLAWIAPEFRPGKHPLFIAIASYFVAVALSVLFAIDPMRAWWGNQERMNGLFTLLHFFAWLCMATATVKTWNQWKTLLNYQAVIAVLMALIALWQKADPMLLGFKASDRVGGLLDNPIYMGAYQIFSIFFLALLFLKTSSWKLRSWYIVAFLIDISAFFAGQSRGALVGLAVGIAVFALYYGLNAGSRRARFGIFGLACVAFIAYGTLFAFRDAPLIKNSMFARITDFHVTVDTRLIAWKIAWQAFTERPLTGWGFDNFHIVFNKHYNPTSLRYGLYETWFDRAHNTVLDALAMTGVLGTLTLFGIFGALLWCVHRAFKKQWIDLPSASVLFSLPLAYFVQNLFVFDHPAAFSMSYLLFAFVICATSGPFFREHDPDRKPVIAHEMPWISFSILSFGFIALVWTTSMQPFKASQLSIRANQLFGTQQGLEYALQAEQIWTPYVDEQAYLVGRNFVTVVSQGNVNKMYKPEEWAMLTDRLMQEEFSRHPESSNLMLIYTRYLEIVAGNDKARLQMVDEWYKRLLATSPRRQQLMFAYARFLLRTNRLDEAMKLYMDVRDSDLELGEGHWMYGITLMYDKKDLINGAKEVLLSQSSQYPYAFQDAQEIAVVMHSATLLKQPEWFNKMFEKLDTITIGATPMFETAKQAMMASGYIDQANKLQEYIDRAKASQSPSASAPTSSGILATSSYKGLRK